MQNSDKVAKHRNCGDFSMARNEIQLIDFCHQILGKQIRYLKFHEKYTYKIRQNYALHFTKNIHIRSVKITPFISRKKYIKKSSNLQLQFHVKMPEKVRQNCNFNFTKKYQKNPL